MLRHFPSTGLVPLVKKLIKYAHVTNSCSRCWWGPTRACSATQAGNRARQPISPASPRPPTSRPTGFPYLSSAAVPSKASPRPRPHCGPQRGPQPYLRPPAMVIIMFFKNCSLIPHPRSETFGTFH